MFDGGRRLAEACDFGADDACCLGITCMTDHNHNDERSLLGENCKRELTRFHPDGLAESKSGGWNPRQWASLIPCGVNQQHSNAYQDIVKAI